MSGVFEGLSAVVLAAGFSRRFGERNKLLETVDGEALVVRAVRPFLALGLREVVVVLGHEAERVGEVLRGLPVGVVVNPDYADGMGESLAFGVKALLGEGVDGCLVSLGDLGELRAVEVREVCSAFYEEGRERVVVPAFKGRRGHPVCFPRRCFGELGKLAGDRGAKGVIERDGGARLLEVEHAGCVLDLDTVE